MKNEELACKTLDAIRANPRKWNQKDYFCGTTACFAGHAIFIHYGFRNEEEYRDWQRAQPESEDWSSETIAGKILGWNKLERDYVFGCMTSEFSVLEKVVKDVLNGKFG